MASEMSTHPTKPSKSQSQNGPPSGIRLRRTPQGGLGTGPKPPHPWLLRRADQAAIAGLALAALVALACYWTAQGGWSRRLIEIDREPPREAQFLVDLNT